MRTRWNSAVKTECLGCLAVDYQLKFDWGLDGKLARLGAFEDAIDVDRRAPKIIEECWSVSQLASSKVARSAGYQ
jgi:hypothetical protein